MRAAAWILMGLLSCVGVPAVAGDEPAAFSLSANGSRSTRPFTVSDRWELRWDVKGEMFSASLYSAKGEPIESLASARKPGSGATFYPKGGSYFVKISAIGDWSISVVQLP